MTQKYSFRGEWVTGKMKWHSSISQAAPKWHHPTLYILIYLQRKIGVSLSLVDHIHSHGAERGAAGHIPALCGGPTSRKSDHFKNRTNMDLIRERHVMCLLHRIASASARAASCGTRTRISHDACSKLQSTDLFQAVITQI